MHIRDQEVPEGSHSENLLMIVTMMKVIYDFLVVKVVLEGVRFIEQSDRLLLLLLQFAVLPQFVCSDVSSV